MEKRELIILGTFIAIMSLILSFTGNSFNAGRWPVYLLYSLVIISISVFAKKITADILDIKIEHKLWQFQRYWFYKKSHFKNPLPVGLIIPILFSFLSSGFVKCFWFLQFESEALPSKVAKRYGRYGFRRYSEIMEWDLAIISFYSLIGLLALSLTAKFLGIFELAKYSLYFTIWNMAPLSNLEGSKIFFGSRPLYIFSLVLIFIAGLIVFF